MAGISEHEREGSIEVVAGGVVSVTSSGVLARESMNYDGNFTGLGSAASLLGLFITLQISRSRSPSTSQPTQSTLSQRMA